MPHETRSRAPLTLALLGLVLAAVQACGAPPMSLDSYDQRCAVDSDCVEALSNPSDCRACVCPDAAINRNSFDRYHADRQLCRSPAVTCGPCPSPRAYCSDGVCALRTGP